MGSRMALAAHVAANGLILGVSVGGFGIAVLSGGMLALGLAVTSFVELSGFAATWHWCRGCPFTQLEQRLLAKEGLNAYEGSCLVHYARQWLGITLTERGADVVSFCVILLPAAGATLSLL